MDAIDDLGDAIDVTREFLTPVRAGTWLRLALVVFFVTGLGFVGPSVPTMGPSPAVDGSGDVVDGGTTVELQDPETGETVTYEITAEFVLAVAAALVVVGALLWSIVAFLASVMDFVLVASLRSGEVRVRRHGSEHLGRAARLFGFRFVATAIAYGPLLLALYWTLAGASDPGDVAVGTLVVVGLATVILAVVHSVVVRLTREFVVPVMVLEGGGVLSGWRRFWPTLAADWTEYLVYYVATWVLGLVAAIAAGAVAAVLGIAVAIPVVVLALVLLTLGTAGLAALAVVLAVAFVLLVLGVLLFEVPIVCYLRYYALLVLGDTNDRLDLIPDRRAAVRVGGGGDGPGGDRWDESGRWDEDDGRDGSGRSGESGGGTDRTGESGDWSDWSDESGGGTDDWSNWDAGSDDRDDDRA